MTTEFFNRMTEAMSALPTCVVCVIDAEECVTDGSLSRRLLLTKDSDAMEEVDASLRWRLRNKYYTAQVEVKEVR